MTKDELLAQAIKNEIANIQSAILQAQGEVRGLYKVLGKLEEGSVVDGGAAGAGSDGSGGSAGDAPQLENQGAGGGEGGGAGSPTQGSHQGTDGGAA